MVPCVPITVMWRRGVEPVRVLELPIWLSLTKLSVAGGAVVQVGLLSGIAISNTISPTINLSPTTRQGGENQEHSSYCYYSAAHDETNPLFSI